MPKSYSLRIYNSKLQANPPQFQIDVTRQAQNWRRSIRRQGGYWQGTFTLGVNSGFNLQQLFETWLGYHVEERSGGGVSWEGLVYEMDLTRGGVRRRRSLDLVWDRVKATHTESPWGVVNFVENPGFENYTVLLGNDDFWAWEEANGVGGSVKAELVAPHTGLADVALNGDTAAGYTGTYIRQTVTVTPGAQYKLSFWHHGDGTRGSACYFAVYDPIGTVYLKGPESLFYFDTTWQERTEYFTGPGSGQVRIEFYAPEDGALTGYIDDVELLESTLGIYETAWATVEDAGGGGPIARYGCKEQVMHLDNYPRNTSLARRDTYLAENAWPWPRPVNAGPPGADTLEVTVCGYIFTANFQYLRAGDGEEHDVSDWVSLIVGSTTGRDVLHGGTVTGAGDCEFLATSYVETNTLQVPQLTNVEERAFDVLLELAGLGDATGKPWRIFVANGGLVGYRKISVAPRYFVRQDGIYDTMGGTSPSNPWLMRPAVFRDMSYRAGSVEPGSFLADNRDFYVEEVEMGDGWAQPNLTTALFSESDILQAQADERR